jgi:hypothetical protein
MLIVAAVTAISFLALSVGVVARETRTLPIRLAWASLATAMLGLAAVTFLLIFLVLLWVLVVSVTPLRGTRARSDKRKLLAGTRAVPRHLPPSRTSSTRPWRAARRLGRCQV